MQGLFWQAAISPAFLNGWVLFTIWHLLMRRLNLSAVHYLQYLVTGLEGTEEILPAVE